MPPKQQAGIKRIPLSLALIVPSIALILLVVLPVGLLSFRNGQQAVNNVASQLRTELSSRIQEHVLHYLEIPHSINRLNADAIQQGLIAPDDARALESLFWNQIRVHDSVSSIYFGNTQGGLVDAGREPATGELYSIVTADFKSGTFNKFALDQDGNRGELRLAVPDFDARSRPWYIQAVDRGDATWSDIYVLYTGQDMAIAASRPVYDDKGDLVGVASVDLFLTQLSSFLQSLKIGETGQAFVVERSGLLVASSSREDLVAENVGASTQQRLMHSESQSPLIRGTAQALIDQSIDLESLQEPLQMECSVEGKRLFVQLSPINDEHGLDWLVVVVIPEMDFMGHIDANGRLTALVALVAVAIAVLLGAIVSKRIAHPIEKLNEQANLMAHGNWSREQAEDHWVGEIAQLSESFTTMAERLQKTLDDLTTEIDERQLTEQALRASRERLDLTLQGAELGTWDWNIPTGDVHFNQRWAAMLGYELSEIEPNVSSWERLVHPDDMPNVMEVLTEHLEGRAPIYQTEHRVLAKSGEWKWILDTGKVLVRDEEGKPIRATGTHRDITERKRSEQALIETNHRLEATLAELHETQTKMVQQERLAAVGHLAAGIAHDFNNILTTILGHAELLQFDPEMPDSAQEGLTFIREAGQRAAGLVRQILDFGRKSMRRPQELDMATHVRDVSDFLARMLPATTLFDVQIDPGDMRVMADPAQIQQMMTNLVLNASDAMPNGGRLRIALSRSRMQGEVECVSCHSPIEGEWIRLAIADTGAGFQLSDVSRLFEPFYTTKEVGQGSGLGLPQVLGIIEQHDGHISASSQVGKGSTFACYLPPLASEPKGNTLDRAAPAQQSVDKTILLVEDDPMVLRVTQSALRTLGYTVLTAPDGQQALRIFGEKKDTIDLTLTDMVMPGMDGPTLFRNIRESSPQARVVFMSGYPLDQAGIELIEEGMVDWILKPLPLSGLAEVIGRALAK